MAILSSDRPIVWKLSPQTNVGRAINTGAQRLEEAGIDTARLDAQVILAHALEVDRSWLFAHFEHVLTASQAEYFTELIARRVAYEPTAYLVGRKEFYGIELAVDPRVLIPRPETEMLVDAALDVIAVRAPQPLVAADVGTGSGAVALAVALNAPGTRVYAIDVSADALAVAGANTARHDLHGQVKLLRGDLLAPLPEPVDLVVANLPYVTNADYDYLGQDVRGYEPRLALAAGPEGLDVIARLLPQLPAQMRPGGVAILEIGYNQGQLVLALIRRLLPAAREVELSQDYQGHDRMVTFML